MRGRGGHPLLTVSMIAVVSACGASPPAGLDPQEPTGPTIVAAQDGSSSTAPPPAAPTTMTPRRDGPDLAGIDLAYDPVRFGEDEVFFGSFGAPGAEWGVWFESAEEMAAESHAIILGTVVGNVNGPSFGPEHLEDPELEEGEGDSAFTLTAYEVRVDAVLAGSLPVGGDHVLVGPGGPPLPTGEHGPAVMFLWWGGERYADGTAESSRTEDWSRAGYRLTSPQGVFVAGPEGALNVGMTRVEGFLEDEPGVYADPVAEEVRHTPLADLVDQVRRYPTYEGVTG